MSDYNYRTLARIVLEVVTPVKIGSGEKDLITDAAVALDANGLPYIPGTAIAGVLRHSLPDNSCDIDIRFGTGSENEARGSELIISDAMLIYDGGKVVEGILPKAARTPFLTLYNDLPIRQHVRIGASGTAEKGGKFDECVVFAGSRFCFEAELLTKDSKGKDVLTTILSSLSSHAFRIGGGSRRGFGKIEVIKSESKIAFLDLRLEHDRNKYFEKTSSLNCNWGWWEDLDLPDPKDMNCWITKTITLTPDDFFLFASGHGDREADNIPMEEIVIKWENNNPVFNEDFTLIPGSSIKGALAHRIAYHYNRLEGNYAEDVEAGLYVGKNNPAVKELFGDTDQRGHLIISDLFLKGTDIKLFNHNTIDDFTGGTIDGHLYTEKVVFGKGKTCELRISVCEDAFTNDPKGHIRQSLNLAIEDLCRGMLPLGNSVNKGHGFFTGTIEKEF